LDVKPKSGLYKQGGTKSHSVTVDISGLNEATYKGQITITDPKASNSPQTISVTFNMSKQNPPQIWVSTSSLSFSAKEGGANPFSKSFSVKNNGEGTLNYTISDDASWLDVSPSSGSSSGESNTHQGSVKEIITLL